MIASSSQPRDTTEEIAGLVERVTFFNPESGFAVLRVQVRGQREPVTILGSLTSCGIVGDFSDGKGVGSRSHRDPYRPTLVYDFTFLVEHAATTPDIP
jgi:exodeoxyribonuclease V alpha subunit